MKDVIAGNLIRYRKALGLSQERLAEMAGVARQSINNYEKGKTLPDSQVLSKLAHVLDVTMEDLLRQENEDSLQFRFRARESFGQSAQFGAKIRKILETYTELEKILGFHPYAPESTPCDYVKGNESYIQEIATQFRYRLGLGDAPINNLFESVENIGLKVLRYPIPYDKFFGLSACSADFGAFILVNTSNITIERQIFTLAHEIGHLIFHRGDYKDTLKEDGTKEEEKLREEVANYFAGHLLIPQGEFDRFYRSEKDMFRIKHHFRVSYQVILHRLAALQIIDYGREIAKIKSIYKNHYGKSLKNMTELEPCLNIEDFPENVRFKSLVWQALKMGKITETTAAELFNISLEELGKERMNRDRQDSDVYTIT